MPDGHFAPPNLVTGTLTIDEEGKIDLELDGYFEGKHGPMTALVDRGTEFPPDKGIQGKLKSSNRNILLLGLQKNGGRFSTSGISYEGFSAANCLVTQGSFPPDAEPLGFDAIEIDMTGLEEWLRLGSIETKRTSKRITAKHQLPKPDVYDLDGGTLSVRYYISGPYPSKRAHRSSTLTLTEGASIVYTPVAPLPLSEAKRQYGLTQDLFILLTDSDYSLDWPLLKKGKETYQLYFHGHRRSTKAPTWSHCWTNFVQLREQFGTIFDTWRRKHNDFGPGFYLYLGTRRGMKLYVEHRFVNLIWGLESLHRRKSGRTSMPTKLEQKIHRILAQIGDEDDREWLNGRLKNANEPSLQQRLSETFKQLPFGFDKKALNAFCEACARCRNDISHFGGQRHRGNYREFVIDVAEKAEAIAYLYHTLLLQEIGIDPELLKRWVFDGPQSYAIQGAFRRGGLLPPESGAGTTLVD